jgi:uncharacterized repeat protein (TIGR03943 family)
VSQLVRSLLLLAIAGVIFKLLASGQMALYMSPALDPLTAGTGVLLAGMGAHEMWSALRHRSNANATGHGLLADDALSYLLVLVPVGLGLFATPRALDANALGGQDAARVVVAFSTSLGSGVVAPPAQPIRDVADLFTYLRTAGEGGVGQPVHLVGMVARGDSLSADQFVLLRYSIVHCVADAQPLGLLVEMADASEPVSSASWVEIDGTLASTERGGAHLVSVFATRVAPTREPANAYLQIF